MAVLNRNIYLAPFLKQLLQSIGKNYSKQCPECNSNRFDVAITHILEKNNSNNKICFNCLVQAGILSQLIKFFF